MRITKSVYEAIKNSIGSMRPEEGGMLLSNDGGRTVNGFVYDDRGSKTGSAYSPNVDFINEQIKKNRRRGAYFVGMIHSHPRGCTSLSMGRGRGYGYTVSDEDAIHKLMGCMKGTAKLYFPVVQSSDSGSFSMRAFAAVRRQNGTLAITEEPIEIVPNVENEWAREGVCETLGCDKHYGKSVIMIGVDGEREVAEELTRQGVSSFVLVDATRMTEKAIDDGACYFEIGTYAADSVLKSIHAINPFATVKLLRDNVDANVELETFYEWLAEINVGNAVALIGSRLGKNAKRSAISRMKHLGIPVVEAAVKADSVEAFVTLAKNKASYRAESAYINSTLGTSVLRAVMCEVKVRAAINAFSLTAAAGGRTPDTRKESTTTQVRKTAVNKWDSLYSKETIEKKLVVIVGCGGSRSYAENLARSGIKSFVLIDGDKYSATNVQTQTSYLSELGRNKAEVIGERIRLIAPDADIKIIPRMLDERVSDEKFESWIGEKLKSSPKDVLISACTDNFHAQARCSRLALKYGTPFIQAGIYTGGRVLELIFFHPAASTVCPRCMLEGRYRANLEAKEKPAPAQSHGTSVFFTEELNAKKGFISLALLLYREPDADARYSEFIDNNKWVTHGGKHRTDRNFMYFTMDSDLEHHTGRAAWAQFDKWGKMLGSNYQLGVCLFRKKQPRKDCPDCRGIGDLSKIRGKIRDTRSGIYDI